jgi:F420-non-reducing hydrogenase small subunit
MVIKVAEEWFGICAGCEVSILDLGDELLDLLPSLDFVHIPVLVDHKYFGQKGERHNGVEIPEADVGILTGCIRNEENRHIALEMRKKCKTLISLGSCACFGGIPALANLGTAKELLEKVYNGSKSTDPSETPSQEIPPLTDRVYAVSEVVKPDVMIPGCPPEPSMIKAALLALLEGRAFRLPEKSVCDECPTVREKKALTKLKRPLEPMEFKPLNETRCFMEQGFLCLGPATRAGCSGEKGGPRCVLSYMPCRGCSGPMKETANPMVDMMTALSSIGLDPKEILDRAATFNRYAGGQGRLRPIPTRK